MRRRKTGLVCGMRLASAVLALFAVIIGCGGGGGGSTPPPTPPGAPSSFTADAGDNSAVLTWSPITGATSYNIYYSASPGVTKTSGTKISGVQSPYNMSGLSNGTAYYFVVAAVNAAGESGISAEKTATPSSIPPPGAPVNVRAAAGDNQATISWDAVNGAASYNIYRGTSSGVTKTTGTQSAGATSPSVVSGLANGTAYFFVVTAVNANGESAESFEVSATPAATPPPAAPGGISATPGDAQASVNWSAVAGATSYNLYWATSSGVTKTTGTKITGVTSPKVVTGLANGTKYYFIVTAVGAGGESAESAEVFATPVAPGAGFSQADVTGTWDGIRFSMGSDAGWARMGANIDGSGSVTATYVLDSTGDTTLPAPGSFTWIISGTGVVTESGVNADPNFRGQMSSNKQLVIVKRGAGGGNTSAGLMVFRKRTGTAFSNADLANKTFISHNLHTGTDNEWSYEICSTDSSNLFTITSEVTPSGPQAPGTGGTFSVNSAGIVTIGGDAEWYGLMTDDKKVIFYIEGSGNTYTFGVITITGQSYIQPDLAGVANFIAVRNNLNAFWAYGTYSVDASGSAAYLSYADSLGGPAPANFSRVLSANGVMTDPADATYHGQLSYNKDLMVRTNTNASGRHGLAIGFK